MGCTVQLQADNGSTYMSEPTIDRLLYLGITHQSAPLAIRELLHTDQDIWHEFMTAPNHLEPTSLLVLSTCDRFEIYALSSRESLNDWLAAIARVFGLSPSCLAPYTRSLTGDHAARHLLRVTAGMESRIIGEPHILSQLRQAFDQAKKIGTVGATLSALCRSAIHTGKRVRKETDINGHRQSIVSLTLQDMQRTLHRLQNSRIAIVGTGTLASGFVAALKDEPTRLVVVSDSLDRAQTLASTANALAWTREEFLNQLPAIDIVVMCTTCSSYILDTTMLASAALGDLSIWDLSSPRAVEPSVGHLYSVCLTHLDDLVQNLPDRPQGQRDCEDIVQQELSRLIDWSNHRRAAPKISRLIKTTRHQASQDGQVIDTRRLHHQIMRLKQEAAA